MATRTMITVDGNEAAASVAHRLNEVIVIYPITPSSPMGETADEWSAHGRTNIWGAVPEVVEMQSEAGAIGSVHGVLQSGALASTFTASQGLLLMIPSMYKIAGELTPFCMHVAARTVATHALSIFADHSDVMACRQTGFGMLCSASVQEAHDFAAVSQAATLSSRIPFMHFFDGFRTSHEVSKIEQLSDDDLRAMIDEQTILAHRARALDPDAPKIRGTAQNPDVFFQAREACNPFYDACPDHVQEAMDRFARIAGRQYRLFDYVGHPEADRVIVVMGSGAETVDQTVQRLQECTDQKVGVVKVRLFRPFSVKAFASVLPHTVRSIAVLDRTKEPGSIGEPLYQDVLTALEDAAERDLLPTDAQPMVVGGRYGLSSKEFTPAMVKAVFDHLVSDRPRRQFTIGITDDVTHRSLAIDPHFNIESDDIVKAVFFGLGSDGTVGANKNSIKIIGEETSNHAQGYFVYDSKKSGAMTISHLRFGPRHIRSAYLIRKADFVACHQFVFMDQYDVLDYAAPDAVFLLNSPYGPDEVFDHLPRAAQQQIIEKRLKVHVIDAYHVAGAAGMGRRINTVMQTCFFAISGVLPRDEAIAKIKATIEKTYGKKGAEIVRRNWQAVDATLDHLYEAEVPAAPTTTRDRPPIVPTEAPDFVQRVTAAIMEGHGDLLPVSAFPPDGTWPTGTTQWEKRNIATEVPIWDPSVCIQCNKCALVCPHAAIRAKVYDDDALTGAPGTFQSVDYKAPDFRGLKYTIQVAPEDCTGCALCVEVCPAKNKARPRCRAINMTPHDDVVDRERQHFDFFLDLPEIDRAKIARVDAKGTQFLLPLFEYSGACAGCGETPYVKLLTQLFGERMMIANATGCSSIYGGNLPTTPYCTSGEGRGPTWANSLFEDNAEFGLGFRLAVDSLTREAADLLQTLSPPIDEALVAQLLAPPTDADEGARRERIERLRQALRDVDGPEARRLEQLAGHLVPRSVWMVGGDGWAYDIGYGGLDHVLSMHRNVNVIVLDTEVYSNTGGQQSKSTPLGAAAKFASAGKQVQKKDLGLMAMSYGHVYVASIAMGANDNHTVRALLEAESYPGPSLVIAYSHCIAHGYDLRHGMDQQKLAVGSGVWPLYRFDPRRIASGKPPLQVDTPKVKSSVREYMRNETRFRMVEKIDPDRFRRLERQAERHAKQRVALYEQLAHLSVTGSNGSHAAATAASN
ncbi:MAG: pyruvate:ferredoxin (flavodoxin) oxidoreductase [Phycisphaeraceae bacterium]|nr:pyruvate:ferredoxin (flavodoxin) oxidoreductase [Phycisphaeraceae bacterium]